MTDGAAPTSVLSIITNFRKMQHTATFEFIPEDNSPTTRINLRLTGPEEVISLIATGDRRVYDLGSGVRLEWLRPDDLVLSFQSTEQMKSYMTSNRLLVDTTLMETYLGRKMIEASTLLLEYETISRLKRRV